MKFFKTKKSKVLVSCLAVILIASILCVTLVGCKNPLAGKTELSVFFVGDYQSNIDADQLAKITIDGEEITSIDYALEQLGITYKSDPKRAAAAMYAVAVTNYSKINQSAYKLITDAHVSARDTRVGNAEVGIKSTVTSVSGANGHFGQTIAGVTQLDGLGALGDVKKYFGSNNQDFSNDNFYVRRNGGNSGANFPGKDDGYNVNKYLLGAFNDNLAGTTKKGDIELTIKSEETPAPQPDAYVQTATTYPEKSILAGKELPKFDLNRKPWDPLNRIPDRYIDSKTGETIENYGEPKDTGIRYYYGNYGAGFATYDFSRDWYLEDSTKIEYVEDGGYYIIEIKVKDEYVQQAGEFSAGTLIRDTKDYIALNDAQYTECSCIFEVYSNGLIKSLQKKDVLNSDKDCNLTVANGILGHCKKGGTTSNIATMVFSYSVDDCDALKYAALYWPELGQDQIYSTKGNKNGKDASAYKLDLSSYTTFDNYEPVVNEELMKKFKVLL